MDKLFKALDDVTRRKIIKSLKTKNMTAGEISDLFKITKPSISHHLDILKSAKIVNGIRDGQYIIYSLNASSLTKVSLWISEIIKSNLKK